MQELRDRKVTDIMDRDCPVVESHISLQDFVDEYLLRSGRRCFVVVQESHLVGLITPNEVRHVERERWPQTSVQSAMVPAGKLRTVSPDTPVMQALDIMSREDINQMPVVLNGELQGIFSRGNIVGFLRNRADVIKH